MPDRLIRRLAELAPLSAAETKALQEAAVRRRDLRADMDLIRVGERPVECTILVEGWACRYKLLPDGKRQITGFVIPGDPCELDGLLMGRMDHSVGTLTPASVAVIPRDHVLALMDRHPTLARAFWQATVAEGAIAREWVVNVGRRSALQRIAHLLCELGSRLQAAGLADASGFALPLTQAEIADAMGLSTVHVNRTVQEMRDEGLIVWAGQQVEVPDWDRLRTVGTFSPDYLFLGRDNRNAHERPLVR